MMRPILGRPAAIVPPSEIQIALLTDHFFLRHQAPPPDSFSPSFSTSDSIFSSDFTTSSSSSSMASSPSRSKFSELSTSFPCNNYPPSPPNYRASSNDVVSSGDVEKFSKGHVTPFKAERFPSRSFSVGSACSSASPPPPPNEVDDFCLDFARYLLIGKKPKTTPANNYICHVCYKTGHYIQNCPKKASYETNTPYQGVKPCFGLYKCPKCKRKWNSTKSYAELKQECKKCKVGAFPYKQMRLDVARSKGLFVEK